MSSNNKSNNRRGKQTSKKKKEDSNGEPLVKFVQEEYKIRIDTQLEQFKNSDQTELRFPSTLNNTERRYVHETCQKMGLASKSRGKGDDRYLTVTKKVASKSRNNLAGTPILSLGNASLSVLNNYLQNHPPYEQEILSVHQARIPDPKPKTDQIEIDFHSLTKATFLPPDAVQPSVQPWDTHLNNVSLSRRQLPVWEKRHDILNTIAACDVTVISGATGCGKSTQVPQYLVEMDSFGFNVICTQPRRLSAVALAERVASENAGGQVGDLVGYSVRLERKRSAKTRLLYCTTGVLLRELAHRDDAMAGVTHLIIDEVHERDINSDFLLMVIREMLVKQPGRVKLILMSATLHVGTFLEYFSNTHYPLRCGSVEVPGKLFHVHELFLEDILVRTNFVDRLMERHKHLSSVLDHLDASKSDDITDAAGGTEDLAPFQEHFACQLCSATFSDPIEFGQHAAFCTGASSQPVASFEVDESFEAQAYWKPAWAQDDADEDGDDMLQGDANPPEEFFEQEEEEESGAHPDPLQKEKQGASALEKYQYARQLIGLDDDTFLDVELVVEVLEQIERSRDDLKRLVHMSKDDLEDDSQYQRFKGKGAVLIFLAGWDEINKLVDELQSHPRFGDESKFQVLPLHSGVSSASQRKVFQRVAPSVRKIICSTNIAETSVTIDDVVYVLDAGTSKLKRYDPHTKVSSLTASVIAKANAIQRAGRAGRVRPGICFRLYSKTRFESMLSEEAPEMQRTSLEEVCLQSRVLLERQRHLSQKMSVARFLARAPDPPKAISVANAMILLEDLGAIDEKENLTAQGWAYAKLPLHPVLAKMVIFGVVFGMTDVAVTLSAFFSVGKDPFVIPLNAADRKRAAHAMKRLSGGSNSDLHTYFQAFQAFQREPSKACRENFLSFSVMNTVAQTKRQILGLVPKGVKTVIEGWKILSVETMIDLLGCVGTFPNVSLLHPGLKKMISGAEKNIMPHKTSVVSLSQKSTSHQWFVFSEMTRSKRMCTIRGCMAVMPLLVALIEGFYTMEEFEQEDGSVLDTQASIHLSEWIEFSVPSLYAVVGLGVLRRRLERVIEKAPRAQFDPIDVETCLAVLQLIQAEKTGQAVLSTDRRSVISSGGRGVVSNRGSRGPRGGSTRGRGQHRGSQGASSNNGSRGKGRGQGKYEQNRGGRGRGRGQRNQPANNQK